MKNKRDVLHSRVTLTEHSCIPHTICLDDFNTNYPNPNRIDRIAGEINEYLKFKYKHTEASK